MSCHTGNQCGEFHDPQQQACGGQAAGEPHPKLGQCLASFRGGIMRNLSWLLSLVAGAVVGFVILGVMIHNDGFWPKDQGLALFQLAMVGLSVTSIGLLVHAIRNANSDLLFFDRGLISRHGKQLTQIKWDEIAAVYEGMSIIKYNHGAVTQIKHKIRFRLRDQREIKLDLSPVPNSEEVSSLIVSAIAPRLIRETQAKLAAGQAADFGFLKVTRDGLALAGDKKLAWRDIGEYTIHEGLLTIRSIKGWSVWAKKGTDEIPNFRVLVAFLEHHRSGQPLPGSKSESEEPELVTL
jgi:Family of unknown function (DUF6585)